jgi:integrase
MNLTELKCRSAKPKEKAYRLYDANYLYLEVTPSGSKLWRMICKTKEKRTTRSLGKYPAISLREARIKRDDILSVIHENGSLPTKETKTVDTTFESVALEYLEISKPGWTKKHYEIFKSRLENYLFPHIGCMHIDNIDPETMLIPIKIQIDRQKYDTANRTKGTASQVFEYAIALGKARFNPAKSLNSIMPKVKKKHYAFIEEPAKIGAFLLAMDEYEGEGYIRIGLQLLPLFFVRPGNLRFAEWSEIDFTAKLWRIPAKKMKGRQDHIVPLANQAVALLVRLRELTGYSRYLFPSALYKDRPLSENTFIAAFKRCGYTSDDIVPHGCRHMASTKLHEMGERSDIIEKQMAHADSNQIRAVYNKAEYLEERRAMMQRWADTLDKYRALVKPVHSF